MAEYIEREEVLKHKAIFYDPLNTRGVEISLYGTGKNGRRIMISYTVFGEKTPAWLEA